LISRVVLVCCSNIGLDASQWVDVLTELNIDWPKGVLIETLIEWFYAKGAPVERRLEFNKKPWNKKNHPLCDMTDHVTNKNIY